MTDRHEQLPAEYRAHLRRRLVENAMPDGLHDGLVEYIAARRPTGSFLRAVLTNDLQHAVLRGDEHNVLRLPELIRFLVNYAPAPCWGCEVAVSEWLADRSPVPLVFE
jgi:hypothetical protein